jgi:tetratricopeptide (TPR) repeat protein
MPKPIKKRIKKPAAPEEEVKTLVSKARERIARNQRRILVAVLVFAVVVVSVLGIYFYRGSVQSRAERLEYEGYKLYFGLYESQPMIEVERLTKALESFEKANKLRESPFALFYIASCYYELGKYKEAVSALEELIRKFPRDKMFIPLAYYKMAMAEVKAGDSAKALEVLNSLYTYKTDTYKDFALIEAARLLESMGRTEEAKVKYKTIVERFPQSPFFEEAKFRLEKEES